MKTKTPSLSLPFDSLTLNALLKAEIWGVKLKGYQNSLKCLENSKGKQLYFTLENVAIVVEMK